MAATTPTPPKYDPKIVGQAVLLEIIEQYPSRLTIDELVRCIVSNPADEKEIETAKDAIRDLRRNYLARYQGDDGPVEPTQAALCAYALLV